MPNLNAQYKNIRDALEKETPYLVDDFDKFVAQGDPKALFIWLDELSKKGDLPKEIEPMLTTFFYSIH